MNSNTTNIPSTPFEPLEPGSQLLTNLKKKRLVLFFYTLLEAEAQYQQQRYPKDRYDQIWDIVRHRSIIHLYIALALCTLASFIAQKAAFMTLFSVLNWLGFVLVAFLFIFMPLLSKRPALRPAWAMPNHSIRVITKTLLEKSFDNLSNNDPIDAKTIAYLNVSNAEELFFALNMLRPLHHNYLTSDSA